jgi:L-ascorbate metabolism protein UlaG (beta-lactamase superfamily)
MRITWLGHASFLIESGGKKLVTDPFDKIGLPFPSVEADVVTSSHSHFDHNAVNLVSGSPQALSGPGEFGEGPFRITGIPTFHDESGGSERGDNTVYVIEAEGLRVCHLGDLGHSLSAEQESALGRVDILMIPVGGTYTIDAPAAAQVAGSLRPSVVLPMHYKIPGLSLPIAEVTEFTGLFESVRKAESLEITTDSLPAETEVVVLTRES